jgi:riboflavin kinase/FMN adenylyltransferase
VVEPTALDDRLVSSSLIRQCLIEGLAREATRLLGRPHRIRGQVAHGAGRGVELGFPTANLEGIDTLVPLDGVYAGLAWIDRHERPWPAACNIGPNPTFGEQARKVEAHLIDYKGDLYGQSIEIDFLERLRGTKKFAGRNELLNQIHADVEETRRIGTSRFSNSSASV